MKNNILCVGLVLSMCAATLPMYAQPGSSGGRPAQTSTGQSFSLGRDAAVILGIAATGLGAYGLYRLYRHWSDGARSSEGAQLDVVPLHDAVQRGNIDLVQVLLCAGTNVNATDRYGRTALHHAICYGHDESIPALFEAGADINAADLSGSTPLHHAVGEGYRALAHLLLETGASVDAATNDGVTSLHTAAARGYEETAHLLLEAGASVDAVTNNGVTPLHIAARQGHEAAARVLLGAGASVNAAARTEITPLHMAAEQGHEAAARVLLGAGANVNAADGSGRTPLYWAAWKGHEAIAQVLAARGAVPLTLAACERIISRVSPGLQQRLQVRLRRLQSLTEQASLERKHAIESTLDEVEIDSEQLPRDLQRIIISMSENSELPKWWRNVEVDRLRHASAD